MNAMQKLKRLGEARHHFDLPLAIDLQRGGLRVQIRVEGSCIPHGGVIPWSRFEDCTFEELHDGLSAMVREAKSDQAPRSQHGFDLLGVPMTEIVDDRGMLEHVRMQLERLVTAVTSGARPPVDKTLVVLIQDMNVHRHRSPAAIYIGEMTEEQEREFAAAVKRALAGYQLEPVQPDDERTRARDVQLDEDRTRARDMLLDLAAAVNRSRWPHAVGGVTPAELSDALNKVYAYLEETHRLGDRERVTWRPTLEEIDAGNALKRAAEAHDNLARALDR